jgi:hypothetical protein
VTEHCRTCISSRILVQYERPRWSYTQAALTSSTYTEVVMAEVKSSTEIEYRPIPGFPGYRVGSDGSVWTCCITGGNGNHYGQTSTTWRLRRQRIGKNGYSWIVLRRNGKRVHRMVHQLVLEAFVGERPKGYEACHYPDETKQNNCLCNLRWDTSSANKRDRYHAKLTATHKECRRCLCTKALGEFVRRSTSIDGHGAWCRSCHAKYARLRRSRTPLFAGLEE